MQPVRVWVSRAPKNPRGKQNLTNGVRQWDQNKLISHPNHTWPSLRSHADCRGFLEGVNRWSHWEGWIVHQMTAQVLAQMHGGMKRDTLQRAAWGATEEKKAKWLGKRRGMEVKEESIQRENRENIVPPNFYLSVHSALTHTHTHTGWERLATQVSAQRQKKNNLFYKLVAEQLVETSSFASGCLLSYAACLPKIRSMTNTLRKMTGWQDPR